MACLDGDLRCPSCSSGVLFLLRDQVASSPHASNSLSGGYGTARPGDRVKYEAKMVADDRSKYSPRQQQPAVVDERARMKREEASLPPPRMLCPDVNDGRAARYDDKQLMKTQADDRPQHPQQRYQNWRPDLDSKAVTDEHRHLDDRKRLLAKDEDWFHRNDRPKNDDRLR